MKVCHPFSEPLIRKFCYMHLYFMLLCGHIKEFRSIDRPIGRHSRSGKDEKSTVYHSKNRVPVSLFVWLSVQ